MSGMWVCGVLLFTGQMLKTGTLDMLMNFGKEARIWNKNLKSLKYGHVAFYGTLSEKVRELGKNKENWEIAVA